jgi:hypothetical protein
MKFQDPRMLMSFIDNMCNVYVISILALNLAPFPFKRGKGFFGAIFVIHVASA